MSGPATTGSTADTLCGLGAIGLWSTTVALTRSASEQIGPLRAGAVVYCLAGMLFVAWEGWRRSAVVGTLRLPRRYLIGCGALFVFYTAALFLALGLARDHAQALAVGLVNYLWPALTLLFSVPLLATRWRWGLVPGTALALVGLFLVLTSGQSLAWTSVRGALLGNPAAFGLGLAAAVSWALYSNLARRWGARGGGAVSWFILASGVVMLALTPLEQQNARFSTRVAVEVGFLSVTVGISYVCWERAMRRGNLLLVSACSYLTPLVATLVGCAYLRVTPGSGLVLGALLLVAGSLWSWQSVDAGKADRQSQESDHAFRTR